MPIKITITPEMSAFNDAVQEADTLTDFQFDRESALTLLNRMQQTRIYPYSARALAEAIAGIAVKPTKSQFKRETGLQDAELEMAWVSFSDQDMPFSAWWAIKQGHYV